MTEAFICDGQRTPIGRYGGAFAAVRPDDLGAVPIAALMARNLGVDWSGRGRRPVRLRQPGGRGQPQRRPHGVVARGPARDGTGRHHQPALRLRHGRGRQRGTCDQDGGGGTRHRRRRREHDPRALRHGQGRDRVLPRGQDRGHHTRLAFRQQADEGEARNRFDAGDRRERCRGISDRTSRPGRLRLPQPAPCGPGCRGRPAGERDHPGHGAATQERPGRSRARRASAPTDDARRSRQTAGAVSGGRAR